ncbi:MAG TPA: bifunctional adenosylcobinamide kinase/adenosylcobinamide-phosphate guanylyltransferase [Thiothrix sp.]|nr:bifunctional adenosylcobinamide kinase/adenosylcobinamide-phosphate guanylyltransferase [Thiothrix sp.]
MNPCPSNHLNHHLSHHLILGGARSGKTHYAEQLAQQNEHTQAHSVLYLATAQALDDAMRTRIQAHQATRPNNWKTIEEPYQLAQTLQDHDRDNQTIIVDCLTLWLTNLLCHTESKTLLPKAKQALLDSLPRLASHLIFVSNEVSLGVIPLGELNRRFVDEAGYLHQALAQHVDHVTLMVAGLPHQIK